MNAWLDFNGDGDWDDPNEQIFFDTSLPIAGDNYLNFYSPPDAVPGTTFARFRFSHDLGLDYLDVASDGEVEDYMVEIEEYGEIKWRQLYDTYLPGLHATMPIFIADDWLCNGGLVTEIHWWGNYESLSSGIDHFIINIHSDSDCYPFRP